MAAKIILFLCGFLAGVYFHAAMRQPSGSTPVTYTAVELHPPTQGDTNVLLPQTLPAPLFLSL